MKRNILRKIVIGIMIFVFLQSLTFYVVAEENIAVLLDGNQIAFDVQPQMINDRTMVPMRAIFEALGATVEWDESTNTASAQKDDKSIIITIGSTDMYVNGEIVALDSPACVVDNRTLVPVRAISESFGLNVNWDEGTKTVKITTGPAIPYYDKDALLSYIKSELNIPERDSITYTISEPEFKMALQEYVVWFNFYENGEEMASASWCLSTDQFYTRYSNF